MSSATRLWREPIERATPAQEVSSEARTPAALELQDPELTMLVRDLFFTSDHRTRIFFAAVDRESGIADFCERLGKIIATDRNTNVAVVHGAAFNSRAADLTDDLSKPLPEYTSGMHLAENLWRVPFGVFEAESKNATADRRPLAAFRYSVLAASISDCAAPLFCSSCDGAVLVISANHTHREAALRAKETLLNWNVELLGAVVVNRTFPVPEAIYRRL